MTNSITRRLPAWIVLWTLVVGWGAPAAASEEQRLIDKATFVVEELRGENKFSNLEPLFARAKGVLVIPELVKAGFIIGGEVGDGVLLVRDAETGHLIKRTYGPWMLTAMRGLARLKGLRGTPFDPFGYSAERRRERALITDYEAVVAELAAGLDHDNHALALEIASLPERIRGYGHVKERHLAAVMAEQTALLELWRHPETVRPGAAE